MSRSNPLLSTLFLAFLAAGGLILTTAIGQPVADRARIQRLNNLGVAYMEQLNFEEASRQFSRAIEIDPGFTEGHVNLGIAEFYLQDFDSATQAFEEALKLDPRRLRALYMLGLIYRQTNQPSKALESFSRVHEQDPNDPSTNYYLGITYSSERQYPDAIRHLEMAVREQPYNASAHYNLAQSLMRNGERERAREELATFQQLRGQFGSETIGLQYLEQGKYAKVIDHLGDLPNTAARASQNRFQQTTPPGDSGSGPAAPPDLSYGSRQQLENSIVPYLGSGASFGDFNGDGQFDIFVASSGGKNRLLENQKGRFVDVTTQSGLKSSAHCMLGLWGDFNNDSALDLYLINYGPNQLWLNQGDGTFQDATMSSGTGDSSWGVAGTLVDFDHDGDIDILVANLGTGPAEPLQSGVFPSDLPAAADVLYRNNGDETFSDVSRQAGLSSARHSTGAWITDYDSSRDIDLLLSASGAMGQLWSNLRNGSFQEKAAESNLTTTPPAILIPADLNRDGEVDILAISGQGARVFVNQPNHQFRAGRQLPDLLRPDAGFRSLQAADIDNDGDLDLVSVAGPRLLRSSPTTPPLILLENRGEEFVDVTKDRGLELDPKIEARGLSLADYDADGDLDILVGIQGSNPLLFSNQGGTGNSWVEIALAGTGSNRQGIGTKVEVMAGSQWQKTEVRGGDGFLSQSPPVAHFGLGQQDQLDAVRLLWPGGVVQSEIDPGKNQVQHLQELDRKGTSCPLLYVWNGTNYEFQTDLLGGSAFGYLLSPGVYNYPDSDEYVKLDRDKLRLRDGRVAITLNNQLEEVIFFDSLELVAVDHPSDFEVFPDEKLLPGPPYDPFRIITSRNARPPLAARDSQGNDVLKKIRQIDRRYPDRFEKLPFKGHAKEHSLTLDLGPTANDHAALLMYAWIDYADSSSNLAAHQAGVSLIPPYLQVQDEQGKWVTVIDRMGFPAGLPKLMTVDLTGKFLSQNRQVRIVTNMRIYWDQILIDDSPPSSEFEVRRIKAESADLHFKGFPRFYSPDGGAPKIYDYSKASPVAPWKVHIGAYTRFGDVTPLLESPEDFYVVTRSGDEIEARFDVSTLPALPAGWARDYFVYVVGFGKDMDINSATPDFVGPLPFHGMPSYPYPEGVYPMDEAHQKYLREWNTRLVEEWLPPLTAPD